MKLKHKNKFTKGFTLIELLVVVLIIGILAAIALPQYRRAVEKSKATQALTVLSSIYESALSYYLVQNTWPSSLDELDVEVPSSLVTSEEWKVALDSNSNAMGVIVARIRGKYSGTSFLKYHKHPYNVIPKEKNICQEQRKNSIYIYQGEQGSYCVSILNGKGVYVGENNWANAYVLP